MIVIIVSLHHFYGHRMIDFFMDFFSVDKESKK